MTHSKNSHRGRKDAEPSRYRCTTSMTRHGWSSEGDKKDRCLCGCNCKPVPKKWKKRKRIIDILKYEYPFF